MKRPRKVQPHRPTEYEDIAHHEGWNEGFDAGFEAGKAEAYYLRGHEDGWNEGFGNGQCQGYTQGYADAKAGKPPQFQHDVTPEMIVQPVPDSETDE